MENISIQVIKGNEESLNKYFSEISNIPLLSPDEEVELAVKIHRGNRKALTRLVQANLRFVVRVALDYRNHRLPDDLREAGSRSQ